MKLRIYMLRRVLFKGVGGGGVERWLYKHISFIQPSIFFVRLFQKLFCERRVVKCRTTVLSIFIKCNKPVSVSGLLVVGCPNVFVSIYTTCIHAKIDQNRIETTARRSQLIKGHQRVFEGGHREKERQRQRQIVYFLLV